MPGGWGGWLGTSEASPQFLSVDFRELRHLTQRRVAGEGGPGTSEASPNVGWLGTSEASPQFLSVDFHQLRQLPNVGWLERVAGDERSEPPVPFR